MEVAAAPWVRLCLWGGPSWRLVRALRAIRYGCWPSTVFCTTCSSHVVKKSSFGQACAAQRLQKYSRGLGLQYRFVWWLRRKSNNPVWQADLELVRQEWKLGEKHTYLLLVWSGFPGKKMNTKSDNAFLWNHLSEKSCSLISLIVCCSDLSCCRLSLLRCLWSTVKWL